MSPQMVDMYIALTCIETNLTLKELEANKQHWLNRALTKTRRYAKAQGPTLSVAIRLFACLGLTLAAWVPVLMASAFWPVTVTLYVLCTLKNEEYR